MSASGGGIPGKLEAKINADFGSFEAFVEQFKAEGLHPFSLPLGLREGCVLCRTCNSFPCKVHAKSDADVCCVRPAIARPNVTLWTNACARRLNTNPAGTRVEVPNFDEQLVGALLLAQEPVITISFREGLRLEQMTAKLQTLTVGFDPAEFYRLAKDPPASLLATAPWLVLPKGASLEGFLYPDTYTVLADTSAEELLAILLARFHEVVGDARMEVPKERGLTFFQVVTLASIVEQEAQVDAERPLIAGVYQNRLKIEMALQADPTAVATKASEPVRKAFNHALEVQRPGR